MESVVVILKQLATMAIYCLIGACLHKTNLIGREGVRAFSKLLLYVILPCVIVNSFLREATQSVTKVLLISTCVSIFLLGISMLISKLLLRADAISVFSASFSNAGFMGIPLITMSFGTEPILYIAPFVALLNILQWTYGQNILMGRKSVTAKELVLNPLVIALVVGAFLYALPITLPELLRKPIVALANCNAPIAMIILGFYLAEVPIHQIVTAKQIWRVSLIRLVIIPIVSTLVVAWLPWISATVKIALLIAASAPVGINVAIYAELLNRDYRKAVLVICQSTLLCAFSMPLMVLLLNWLLIK